MNPATATDQLVVTAVNSRGALVANAQQVIAIAPNSPPTLLFYRDGSNLVFEYTVAGSGRYQLQATSDIIHPNWQTVAAADAAAGTVQFQLPAPSAPQMFYRLIGP